jgi:hypothetical protein
MPKPQRSPAERDDAHRLYVFEGQSIESIAVECNIPLGTLKRWAASGYESSDKKSWHAQRAIIAIQQGERITSAYALATTAMKRAQKTGEAKDIFAAVAAYKALDSSDAELRQVKINLEKAKLAATTAHKEGAAEVGADIIWSAMQEVPDLAKVLKNQRVREALKRAIEKKVADAA